MDRTGVAKEIAARRRREGDEVEAQRWDALIVLPTDYTDYGGDVERWKDPDGVYSDCSSGCKWVHPLWSEATGWDLDWLVCTKPGAPRAGLLTFEHQAGYGCFELEDDEEDVKG